MIAKKIKELTGHSGAVYCLSSFTDEKLLLSGSADGFVAGWDLDALEASRFSVKVGEPIFALSCDALGQRLYIGTFKGKFHVVDLNHKTEIANKAIDPSGIYCIDFNRDKNQIYIGTGNGHLLVMNDKDFKVSLNLPFEEGKIRCVKSFDNGRQLGVGFSDGHLRIFETEFFNCIHEKKLHSESLNDFFVDKNFIWSVGKDGMLMKYDRSSDKVEQHLPAHNFSIYKILPISDLSFATCSRDKTIKLWNKLDLMHPTRLDFSGHKAHTHSVNALFYSDKRKELVSASDDKKLIVWKVDEM